MSKIHERSVAESLKIVLVKKGLNQARLAGMLGVSSTTIYSKFKRESFTVKDLDEISKALGIRYEISFIMDDDE